MGTTSPEHGFLPKLRRGFDSLPPSLTPHPQCRQVQELENKFKDAYSHNLSTKDERIQVLEKRVDETIRDNTQLREDLVTLRKQNERLRSASPRSSPFSPRENSDSIKMKEKVTVLQEEVREGDCYITSLQCSSNLPWGILKKTRYIFLFRTLRNSKLYLADSVSS